MMADLAQPIKIIARWPMRGDLRIVVDGDYTYLRASDVETLAGIPAWGDGEALIGDDSAVDFLGEAHYLVDVAVAKVRRHADEARAAEFVTWLDEALPDLLDPQTVDDARVRTGFGAGLTVRNAARRLTDAGVRIGRTGLFTTLQSLGWTRREGDSWALTSLPLDLGWAATRRIRDPRPGADRHATYEQIYILPAGLDRLVELLHAPDTSRVMPASAAHVLPLAGLENHS